MTDTADAPDPESDVSADSPAIDLTAGDELAALRQRVLVLANSTLTELERDLRRGSLTQRNTAIRLIAPYLLKSLDSRDEDHAMEQMKAAFAELMSRVMHAPDEPTQVTAEPEPMAVQPGEIPSVE